jgi:hypothetical protein
MQRPACILLCLLVAGCFGDKFNSARYKVASTSRVDRARITEITRSIATETGLTPDTPPPALPNALAYYRRPPDHGSAVDLSVERSDGDIIVHLGAGTGPTPRDFTAAQRLLDRILLKEFASRCTKSL